MLEGSFDNGALDIHEEFPVEFNGRKWIFWAHPLAPEGSLSTTLSRPNNRKPDFWLDWHDVLNNHGKARVHLYMGADKTVPFEEKLERMESWADAIQMFDSLMLPVGDTLSKTEAETLLKGHHLPKLNTVVIDTGTQGLRQLFTTLGFPVEADPPNPFTPPWDQLVELARSGVLVSTWRKQKGK